MNLRVLVGNFSVALVAQGTATILSLLTSLLVPKVLGVEEFGYWQLFIFYVSYVAVFHLGLDDGIYLVHGGETREDIDKRAINSCLRVGMTYQTFFALVIILVACVVPLGEKRQFVVGMLAIFMLLNNFCSYCTHVFQAINETKLYSASVMVDRLVFLVPLVILIAVRCTSFEAYVFSYAFSKACSCAYCAYNMRDFFRSGVLPLGESAHEALRAIKVGISLLVANVASMLILGMARFFVDAAWGIESFAQFSLALTMTNFFITFVSQLAMVLFPALRQAGAHGQTRGFEMLRSALSLVMPLVYIAYFPIAVLVGWWLPAYADAVSYMSLVLPICVFESRFSLVGSTYFKVLRGERTMLTVNCATVVASAAGTIVGVYVIGSIEFVMCWVVSILAVRSIWSERWTQKHLETEKSLLWLADVTFAVAFVLGCGLLGRPATFLIVTGGYIAFLVMNRHTVHKLRETMHRAKG